MRLTDLTCDYLAWAHPVKNVGVKAAVDPTCSLTLFFSTRAMRLIDLLK